MPHVRSSSAIRRGMVSVQVACLWIKDNFGIFYILTFVLCFSDGACIIFACAQACHRTKRLSWGAAKHDYQRARACRRVERRRSRVHAWAYALHALARRRGVLNSCGAHAHLQVGLRWLRQQYWNILHVRPQIDCLRSTQLV